MDLINRGAIRWRSFLSLQVVCCLLGVGVFVDRSFGQAGEAKKTTAIEQVSAELELKKTAFQTRRKKIFSQYAVAVENLGKEFQQSGDLDGLIKAKREAKIARENNTIGNDQFRGIDKLRETLRRELKAINEEERKALIVHREHLIQALTARKVNFTKAGKLGEALDADKALKQLEIDQSEANRVLLGGKGEKPGMADESEGKQLVELGNVSVVMGRDADPYLKRFDPRKSLVRRAELKASSFYPHRKPENVVSPRRPDKLEDIKRDEWAMTESTGWLQADWKDAVPVKTILLVNRLTDEGNDQWVEGRVVIDGEVVGGIKQFGGKMLALIELKAEVPVKTIRLEVLKGSQSPGLTLFEVYPGEGE